MQPQQHVTPSIGIGRIDTEGFYGVSMVKAYREGNRLIENAYCCPLELKAFAFK